MNVIMDLTFTAFNRFCAIVPYAKIGCNWTTNNGETEGEHN